MLPKIHFLISLILAIILFPFYSYKVLIVFITGFLIDIDHLFVYFIRFKNFNIRKAYPYFKKMTKYEDVKNDLYIFHTIEFLILAILLSFYNVYFFLAAISLIIHITLDWIEEFHEFGFPKSLSFFVWLFKYIKKGNFIN